MRASAVLLVIWDHMVGQWLDKAHRGWRPLSEVRRFVTGPLNITQDFGWLGVVLFFLVSGFIISHVSIQETAREFLLKRFFRIYPALVIAVLVVVFCIAMRQQFDISDQSAHGAVLAQPTVPQALRAMTLVNYVQWPQHAVVGVAWTLVIEIFFYLVVFAIRPFLKSRLAGLGSWLTLGLVLVFLESSKQFALSWFLISASMSYVPLLVLGQALWLRWSGRIGWTHFAALTIAAWAVFVHGLELLQPGFLSVGPKSYGPSIVLGYGLFVAGLLGAAHLRERAVVEYVATRSYSLYLLHGTVGLLVEDAVGPHIPFTIALTLSLAATGIAAELSYRLVEVPSRRLARLLTGRLRRPQRYQPVPAASPAAGRAGPRPAARSAPRP